MSSRVTGAVAIIVAIVVLVLPQRVAAISFDDPNVFGPGEGWGPPPELGRGDQGYGVSVLQRRLTDLGFRPGPINGVYDDALAAAVVAFHKAYGLERDSVFKASDWQLLNEPVGVAPALTPTRVEVDLARQVLFLIVDNQVETVVPVSTGSGGTYRGLGGVSRARTPEGAFSFYRHVNGWRISYLGGLYEPYYFTGGYAIHGSLSVPAYPASHGCIRVRISDMDFLRVHMEVGMPVYVYGVTLSRNEVVPEEPELRLGGSGLLSSSVEPPASA
jgi:N-acetylmuramoyl-L-alanine amidase